MSEYFIFDNVNCRTHYQVHAFEKNTFGASARVYNNSDIPGKNGSVLIDGKKYPNITHSYACVIYNNCIANLNAFREFLLSRVGYCRLEDSIHSGEYYMAFFRDVFEPILDRNRDMCKFELAFERKPQRFLTSGNTVTTFTSNGSINNPSRFPSLPLIRVYGTGNLGVGGQTITISQNSTYIDIDCEIMEAFTGSINKNSAVSFSGNDFPTLHYGSNVVSLGSGISKVEITPRWFTM